MKAWRYKTAQIVIADNESDRSQPVMIHSFIDRDSTQSNATALLLFIVSKFHDRTIKASALHRHDICGIAMENVGFVKEQFYQFLMQKEL